MDKKQSICVDNWGDSTVKRMQQFFFHSKHCDLTLRFNNNTALTVHRLILRMYTDYFDRLVDHYKTNESVVMPIALQSDVILPIIKFFYTGSIEFYDHKLCTLLQAAKLIRVPILVELLVLHQRRIRNRAKITNTLTTLTEKNPIVHSLFANRDITVNVLDRKHKMRPTFINVPMVKKIKVSEIMDGNMNENGETNISIDDSQPIDLIDTAAIDGPLRFSTKTEILTRSESPFGKISYENMVDDVAERNFGDAASNIKISCQEKSALASVTSKSPPTDTIKRTPKKSFKEYIDFPIHDLSNDQFFASDNVNSTDHSIDADNLSFIELCSDAELFEVIELDY